MNHQLSHFVSGEFGRGHHRSTAEVPVQCESEGVMRCERERERERGGDEIASIGMAKSRPLPSSTVLLN